MPHSRDEAQKYIKTAMRKGYLRGKDEPLKQRTFRISIKLDDSLVNYCRKENRSVGFIIRVAIEEYLSKNDI